MNKKKLVYYVENYYYGGLEKFVKDLLAHPPVDDCEIIVYCNAYNRRFIE